MKMICLQAKTTGKRDKAIEAVLAKHPELNTKSLGTWKMNERPVQCTYSYVKWVMAEARPVFRSNATTKASSSGWRLSCGPAAVLCPT